MNNYDFSTLNDKEFEEIVKDILNNKFEMNLQSFKKGKDKGVDLRFSTPLNDNSVVVQVKHYINSKYSNLKSKIKNEELDKVKKLNPERYILVTSLILSVSEKDELRSILSPFVLTSNDIITQIELNSFLTKDIETKYYKLWLSSSNIISNIIKNGIESRTKFFLEQLKEKMKFYVITEKLNEAQIILKKEKVLLITGQPGIGKSSLAEIILYERAKNNFKIHKIESITEAEDIFSPNPAEKQVFYFDDFLGANYNEIINSHRTETQLTFFVERILKTPNKYLILTVRTVILNYAVENYEKISNSRIGGKQFEVKLYDYTKYEKALILYNHFYYRNINEIFYNVLLHEKFYLDIIEHENYTPRIIDFITEERHLLDFDKDKFHQFIVNNLNNPKAIWKHSYSNQIGYFDRCLLLTLFTFRDNVSKEYLVRAFESRLTLEKEKNNQILTSGQFDLSISILLNGFISSTLINYDHTSRLEFRFINPSLSDFLISYINDSYGERKDIIESIIYTEQLKNFNPIYSVIPLEKELQAIIRDKISRNELSLSKSIYNKSVNETDYAVEILDIISTFCKNVNTDIISLEFFKKLDFTLDWDPFDYKIIHFLLTLEESPLMFSYVVNNFYKIFDKLTLSISEEFETEFIVDFFKKYNFSYKDYVVSKKGEITIKNMIKSIITFTEENLIDQIKYEVSSFEEVQNLFIEINSEKNKLIENLLLDKGFINDLNVEPDEVYWEDRIEENQINNYDHEYGENSYNKDNSRDNVSSIDEDINQLFDR